MGMYIGPQEWWFKQKDRSLRFNSADSAYLSRTPASAGNRTTWTWAGWVKKCGNGTYQGIFTAARSGFESLLIFNNSDKLEFYNWTGSYNARKVTTAVFRDPSAWYHIVFTWDSANATAADRCRLYVNGVRYTIFDTSTDPTSSSQSTLNDAYAHQIGNYADNPSYDLNGYLADVHFIDGQALDPTSFGEFDSNGVWQAKTYTGTYGQNGFYLNFNDNSSTAALGTDISGNENDWTPNNFSVTAGSGNDSLVDVPTNGTETDTGVGGEVRGNYCTLNPLDKGGGASAVNGNLDLSLSSAGSIRSTIGMSSGKWFFEVTVGAISLTVGIAKSGTALSAYLGSQSNEWSYGQNASKITGGSSTSYGVTFTTGDVIGAAFDADNGTLTFYKNGSSQGTAFTGLTSGPYFFAVGDNSATSGHACNFGQRPFAYPVSGFKALCTANLPDSVIEDGSKYMDVKTYIGNGGTQSITGLGFSPSLVWYKSRNNVGNHALFDVVRGATKRLISNDTAAEDTRSGVTAFNSDGWTEGSFDNQSGYTYVGWAWDAGSSTVTDNTGTIQSSRRTNATAGFSIVTYTGTGANATVGHGLGSGVGMLIIKNRDSSDSWTVGHTGITLGSGRLYLDTTDANDTAGAAVLWNSTAATSSVFSIGTNSKVNSSGVKYVAYVFSPVEGYSAFGSYTGNGSTDGPFVYTGFRPRWVMFKRTNAAYGWLILDTERDTVNVMDKWLEPNLSSAESTIATTADFLSNGFKLRNGTWNVTNASGGTYIYAAFAENPFKVARAR